jgi:flagellar FliJ protein
MPFRFSLASILRLRENLEEQAERALQMAQLKVTRVVGQIEELDIEISRMQAVREQAMKEPISAAQLQMFLAKLEVSGEKKKALRVELETLKQARDHQMMLYRTAHRNREALTDMSAKLEEAYDVEQERVEQNSLDEIFVMRRHQN